MKSEIFGIVCLALFASTLCQSQFLLAYGLKFGVASARQTWNYSIATSVPAQTRWGLDIAVSAEALNLPCFSILGELHYVQKGFLVTLPISTPAYPEGTGDYILLKPEVDYISFPLLAKVRLQGDTYSPFLTLGPRIDVLVRREADGFELVFDRFSSVDGGVSAGIGLDIRLTTTSRVSAEFRYSPDFTDAHSTHLLAVRNQSKEFLLGVSF